MCIPSRMPQSASAPYRFCLLLSHWSISTAGYVHANFALQNCPFMCRDLDLHLLHRSLGPRVHTPNNISISWGLTNVTDQQTDRIRYSVCNNRLHLHSTTMWPKNSMNNERVESKPITALATIRKISDELGIISESLKTYWLTNPFQIIQKILHSVSLWNTNSLCTTLLSL